MGEGVIDYYGRIVVLDSPGEGDDMALEAIGTWLSRQLAVLEPGPDLLDVRWLDGTPVFTFSGLRDPGGDFFDDLLLVVQLLAVRAPGSYGTVHCHDDDLTHPYKNEFRVFVVARGRVTEQADPFLSPVVPTVEDPVE